LVPKRVAMRYSFHLPAFPLIGGIAPSFGNS
jgi:hypothetical protein